MGADIELYVERKRNGKWVHVNPPEGSSFAQYAKSATGIELLAEAVEEDPVPARIDSWHVPRHYVMFGMLAGVRWYDWQYKPALGIPKDVSEGVKAIHMEVGSYCYCATFYGLHEIRYLVEEARAHEDYYPEQWEGAILNLLEIEAAMETIRRKYDLQVNEVRAVMWFD